MSSAVLFILVAALGILSLVQRVVPWAIYSRIKDGTDLTSIFDLLAVSAFSALMVSNIYEFNLPAMLSLLPALAVAYKTRNLGATVLVAMLFSVLFSLI